MDRVGARKGFDYMDNKLIIIGASGHGKVVADIGDKMSKWESIGFLDDDESIMECGGLEVLGRINDVHKYIKDADFFVAIGNNSTRKKIQEKLESLGASIATLVHPRSVLGPGVDIGSGTAVMAGVVINSSSTIGKGCIINTNASLDHDNILGDYVHISPGANIAGSVKVGQGTWIGIGASVINDLEICEGCKIGAGAVVTKNLLENDTYMGVPAKRVDR